MALNGSLTDATSVSNISSAQDACTYIFIGEMGLKLIAFTPKGYVQDRMNIFDGTIVMISLIELIFLNGSN